MASLWIMSDLHLEASRGAPFRPETLYAHDVVVLAGDVSGTPIDAAAWATATFRKPIVCVAGNHEFYGTPIEARLSEIDEINGTHEGVANPVHYLENRAVVIAGVRFLGCTLWTDFELGGDDPMWTMRAAEMGVPDYRFIPGFVPGTARSIHQRSRIWLEEQLTIPFDGPTVVVTHHAPSEKSIADVFKCAITSPAYASDLDDMILRWQPALWIHGHVHTPFDYRIGRTRVLCNPKGFSDEGRSFRRDLVVEV